MKQGFTLVELAIVLVIIGLLVGGVLQGQELIQQAKYSSQISEWGSYKTSFHTYYAKYNRMPGDDNKATLWFGAANTRNGDNDRTIEYYPGGGYVEEIPAHYDNTERCMFFEHLALAGLSKFKPAEVGSYCGNAFFLIKSGVHIPSLMGSGVNYWYVTSEVNGLALPNIRTVPGELNICTGVATGLRYLNLGPASIKALTQEQALFFDTKLDDGLPLTGRVRAVTGANDYMCSQKYDVITANGCKTAGGEYDLSYSHATYGKRVCALSIKMGF